MNYSTCSEWKNSRVVLQSNLDDRGNKADLIIALIKVPVRQILELATVEELQFICGNLDLPDWKKAIMIDTVAVACDETRLM